MTMLDTRSPLASSICWAVTTCATISPAVKLRFSPPSVDAQNVQPIRQPTCVVTHMLFP